MNYATRLYKSSLPHLFSRVFETPLAIYRPKLDVLLTFLGPRMGVEAPVLGMEALTLPVTPKQASAPASVSANVAVIEVNGTLVNRAAGMDAMSGLCTYEELSSDVQRAAADPNVAGILLRFDSFGGECQGMLDCADAIAEASKKKLCYASIDDNAMSAAYGLASACDYIFISRTGGAGSIGVIAMHVDQTEADAKEGLKYTTIFAGANKNALNPHEPLSDAALGTVQAEVDRLYGMFVSTVAQNRGMKSSEIKATEAGVYYGADAVRAGLADEVGTFSDALAALMDDVMPSGSIPMKPKRRMEAQPVPMSEAEVNAAYESISPHLDYPSQVSKSEDPEEGKGAINMAEQTVAAPLGVAIDPEVLRAEARRQVKAEAAEISELCILAGCPDKAATFIAEGKTVADVRKALITLRAEAAEKATVNSGITVGNGGALSAIESAAAVKMAAGMTKEQAIVAAMKQNPSLYSAYLAENPAQVA